MAVYLRAILMLTLLSTIRKVSTFSNQNTADNADPSKSLERKLSFQSPPDLWKSVCNAKKVKSGAKDADSLCAIACDGISKMITEFQKKYPDNPSVTSLYNKCGSVNTGRCQISYGFVAMCKCRNDYTNYQILLQKCRVGVPKTTWLYNLKNMMKKHGPKAKQAGQKAFEQYKKRKGKKGGKEKKEGEEKEEEGGGSSSDSDSDGGSKRSERVQSEPPAPERTESGSGCGNCWGLFDGGIPGLD